MYPQLLPTPFLPSGNGGATEADLRLFGWPKDGKDMPNKCVYMGNCGDMHHYVGSDDLRRNPGALD